MLINGTELGTLVMRSRGFFPEPNWYWIGLGAVIGFTVLFNTLFFIALTFLGPYETPQAVLPEETVEETQNDDAITRKRGMILPFEPHSIAFDDIKYSVDMPVVYSGHG